jgi:hypothetical protein
MFDGSWCYELKAFKVVLQTAILIEYQDKMEVERVREFLPSWTSPY